MEAEFFVGGYTGAAPEELSPLALAYIGDCVFEMLARTRVLSAGRVPVHVLHKKTRDLVNAKAQSDFYSRICEELSEEEAAVFRRGRNAKSHTVPKNADLLDYRRATGLEALFGYLFLAGRLERLGDLFQKGLE